MAEAYHAAEWGSVKACSLGYMLGGGEEWIAEACHPAGAPSRRGWRGWGYEHSTHRLSMLWSGGSKVRGHPRQIPCRPCCALSHPQVCELCPALPTDLQARLSCSAPHTHMSLPAAPAVQVVEDKAMWAVEHTKGERVGWVGGKDEGVAVDAWPCGLLSTFSEGGESREGG